MATILDTNELMFTAIEPKMKFRFRLLVEGLPTFLLQSAARPKYNSEYHTIHYINKRYKVKTKTDDSGEFSTNMLDPIAPSGVQAIMEWEHLIHEELTGRDGYADMYKKDATVELLGPVGDVVERWVYKGFWPSSIDFGDLDWSSSDIAIINVTFQYDYAYPLF